MRSGQETIYRSQPRSIIEAHGGRLWAEHARSGGGLTFRFTLVQAQGAAS